MPGQPRVYFNEDSITRLADSIRSVGQVYPGIVRSLGENSYELLDGERRWRAITKVGVDYRALVVDIDNNAVPFLIAAIANFNREAHTPLEIADSIEHMYDVVKMPIEDIARILGITVHWTYQMLSLRHLHKDVRSMLDPTLPKDKRLPLTAAIHIAKTDYSLQPKLADRVRAKDVSLSGLRAEVVHVSKKAGTYIRTRREQPHRRWSSIGLRVNQIARMLEDLQAEFSQQDFPEVVSAGSGGFTLNDVLEKIGDARRCLDACEKVLKRTRR